MYKRFFKRILDIVLSAFALILLSWLYFIIDIAIKLDDPGPVFFYQKRVGVKKTHFNIVKFRTMKVSTPKDVPTHLLTHPEQYITRVGRLLRQTSLDELPQIAQIFTGKMSVIGPRPALWNQFDLIAERDRYGANDVTPGLTGWAQVNGRDTIEIADKARYDGEYANNVSFIFDAKIFWLSVLTVLKRDGVVEGGTGRLKSSVKEKNGAKKG